ncbi:hypothetical protein EGI22_16045 [Lacihabitans sp. LS3-19]|uniref:hypothetical protein n=1 Tax=Lacihabitans sp. LS3-19 TaxID=2487335 RepID=UPI0020CFB02B|nr:hypothetical protein [Lacihabitans sp. LS3-19]MCP9769415.1 hypothetical protein [Lacihabitans sp. LS3-19]
MKHKESNFFWVSYSDLMTSLFFIMLTLYVLTVVLLKYRQKATEEQLRKINDIQNATKALPKEYFEYDDRFKRFEMKLRITFPPNGSIIHPTKHDSLKLVGKSIENLITSLKAKYNNDNISYMVVIEGMASKDKFPGNDALSYDRARALKSLWSNQKIKLDPTVCELIVAGSGIGGVGRLENETLNQRFLIQIIPKIGKIEDL